MHLRFTNTYYKCRVRHHMYTIYIILIKYYIKIFGPGAQPFEIHRLIYFHFDTSLGHCCSWIPHRISCCKGTPDRAKCKPWFAPRGHINRTKRGPFGIAPVSRRFAENKIFRTARPFDLYKPAHARDADEVLRPAGPAVFWRTGRETTAHREENLEAGGWQG